MSDHEHQHKPNDAEMQGYAGPLTIQPGYGGSLQIVTGQPGMQPQMNVMPRPPSIPGVPSGLEYLSQIDQLLVHQQIELIEVLTGYHCENKYQIKNSLGQQVYFAAEESNLCERLYCGPNRGFVMHIVDNLGQEVIRVSREFKCCGGCPWCANFLCCAFEIQIEAPVGQVIGTVRQLQSFMKPRYAIFDADMQQVFYAEGPMCICQGICCTQDVNFNVYSPDRVTKVGKMSKQWSGVVREMYTNASNFSVTFPLDLDVRMKATLLGTLFLVDFMYFEQNQNRNNRR